MTNWCRRRRQQKKALAEARAERDRALADLVDDRKLVDDSWQLAHRLRDKRQSLDPFTKSLARALTPDQERPA